MGDHRNRDLRDFMVAGCPLDQAPWIKPHSECPRFPLLVLALIRNARCASLCLHCAVQYNAIVVSPGNVEVRARRHLKGTDFRPHPTKTTTVHLGGPGFRSGLRVSGPDTQSTPSRPHPTKRSFYTMPCGWSRGQRVYKTKLPYRGQKYVR